MVAWNCCGGLERKLHHGICAGQLAGMDVIFFNELKTSKELEIRELFGKFFPEHSCFLKLRKTSAEVDWHAW